MKNSVDESKNMTLAEVADFMRISYKWASENYMSFKDKYGITPLKYGRQVLFSREEVYGSRKKAALV